MKLFCSHVQTCNNYIFSFSALVFVLVHILNIVLVSKLVSQLGLAFFNQDTSETH